MSPADAQAEVRQRIESTAAALKVSASVTWPGFLAPGCVHDSNGTVIPAIQRASLDILGRQVEPKPLTCTTDVRAYELYPGGPISATCFGPEARNIHAADEGVKIDSVMETSAVLAVLIARWCGVVSRF